MNSIQSQSQSRLNKYKLPKLKTTRQEEKVVTSVFHKQRRRYLLTNVLSESSRNFENSICSTLGQGNVSMNLKTVREQFDNETRLISDKHSIKLQNFSKMNKKQLKTRRMQKKVISNKIMSEFETKTSRQSQNGEQGYNPFNQTLERKLMARQCTIQNKPPHRYKTQLVPYQSSLVLFAGIGCGKNLTWAKINFNPQSLQLPPKQTEQQSSLMNTPIYGHTMKAYKQFAYIYGGVNGDILNELLILNMKTLKIKPGPHGPFRRKQHASTMIGRFMLIHGGIQGNQTRNSLFYYDTQSSQWSTLPNTNLPYLSHHSMTTVPSKSRRKLTHISQNNDTVYIFGGKTQTGQPSNKIFKLKVIHDFQVNIEEITPSQQSDYPPEPRYSCCFEYLSNNSLVLYGGKEDTQSDNWNAKKGTFKDVYLFNTHKKTWKRQDIQLNYRQGMASTSVGGKVYIYGGFNQTYYTDGNLLVMKILDNSAFQSSKRQDDYETKQNIPILTSIRKLDY